METDIVEPQSQTILPIDDDEAVQDMFKIVAAHFKHSFFGVKDEESALNVLEKYKPDVIVIDLYLSGTDGYQILAQIRRSDFDPGCPIVATTAYDSLDTLKRVLLAGFDAYLPKPFGVMELMPFLGKVIAGSANAGCESAPALL